jgi:hypothetical protein
MRVHRLPAPSSLPVAAPRSPGAALVLVLAALLLLAHLVTPSRPPRRSAAAGTGRACGS